MGKKLLWYIADPMCSWCWGFTPVMDEVRKTYGDRVELVIVPGGLRPGTKDPLPAGQREEILHHWHTVHRTTGQPFRFEGAMPEGFIYDTEPPQPCGGRREYRQPGHGLCIIHGNTVRVLCRTARCHSS